MTSILDIFDESDDETPDKPVPIAAESAGDFMRSFYGWLADPKGYLTEADERAPGLHASSLWKTCARERMLTQAVLGEHAGIVTSGEETTAGQQLTFGVGHATHHWWQNYYFGPWGRLLGDWHCARCDKIVHNGTMPKECPLCGAPRSTVVTYVESDASDLEIGYTGHADGVLRLGDGKAVFEFKTCSDYVYNKLTCPKPEHVIQVHAYMRALGLTTALIVYAHKGKQCKWTRVEGQFFAGAVNAKAFKVKFDKDLWQNMKRRIADWHKAGDEIKRLPVVTNKDAVKFEKICLREDSILASGCDQRDLCFALAAAK